MPFPIFIGVAAAALVANGVRKVWAARQRYQSAQEAYATAHEHYKGVVAQLEKARSLTNMRLDELGRKRLETLQVLGEAVSFLKKAKLKERNLLATMEIPIEQLEAWEAASVAASEVLNGLTKSVAAGAATAAGTYALVGTLATASTGTAIATLSGAAAQSATLAWLGGGAIAAGGGGVAAGTAVLGGVVAAPAIAVAAWLVDAKVGQIENEIETAITELAKDETEKLRLVDRLRITDARIDEVQDTTIKASAELRRLMSSSDPTDDAAAHRVWRLAAALGKLLEASILDKNGELT
jgi:hypothetical protein